MSSFRLFMSCPPAGSRQTQPRGLVLSNDALFYLWSGERAAWALDVPPAEVALLPATGGPFARVYDFIHVAEAWTSSRIFARALGQIQGSAAAPVRGKAVEQFRHAMAAHRLKQTSEGMAVHLLDVAGGAMRGTAP